MKISFKQAKVSLRRASNTLNGRQLLVCCPMIHLVNGEEGTTASVPMLRKRNEEARLDPPGSAGTTHGRARTKSI